MGLLQRLMPTLRQLPIGRHHLDEPATQTNRSPPQWSPVVGEPDLAHIDRHDKGLLERLAVGSAGEGVGRKPGIANVNGCAR
jgi:hypothetical protein